MSRSLGLVYLAPCTVMLGGATLVHDIRATHKSKR